MGDGKESGSFPSSWRGPSKDGTREEIDFSVVVPERRLLLSSKRLLGPRVFEFVCEVCLRGTIREIR